MRAARDMTASMNRHWLDVLCQHWDQLSEEMQAQVQQYDFWCLMAEQQGRDEVPDLARQLEDILQRHARTFGWKP